MVSIGRIAVKLTWRESAYRSVVVVNAVLERFACWSMEPYTAISVGERIYSEIDEGARFRLVEIRWL